MKAITKVTFLDDNGEKFFGNGPAQLLHEIENTGSLRAAAISMNMAYTKALKILKQAESSLGFPLTIRSVGGKDGGGSQLTPEGKEWLAQYEAYRDACILANQQIYLKQFGNIGCVIMASGLAKRFGSNKLMTDFLGTPVIDHVLTATEELFSKRVVVTRNKEVASFCTQKNIDVILHELPFRSDTVHLGLQKLGKTLNGCMFLQGDQPLISRETITAMALTAMQHKNDIIQAAHNTVCGSPVLFPNWTFPELLELPQGKGGNFIIKKHPEHVRTVQVRDSYELKDIDTPEDLLELRAVQTHVISEKSYFKND